MTITPPTKCYLTDAPIIEGSLVDDLENTSYLINLGDKQYFIIICDECLHQMQKNKVLPKYKAALRSLLMNGKLGDTRGKRFHWDSESTVIDKHKLIPFSIKRELDSISYPKSPKEKLENFFIALHDL